MEFLETFGCIWSSKEVIRVVFGRALPGATSRSDYMRSLCTTSRSDSSRATARSHSRFHIRRHTYLTLERPLRATYQVVFGRALPGATSRSDYMRSLCTTSRSDSSRATARSRSRFHIRRHTYLTLERPLRATYQGRSRSRATRWSDTPKSLATSRPETPKIGPGATSRSDTCKSLRCFDIPQNWFDNLLYYNICLRSLENS
ncbi:hypothetical protein IGI04_026942 [Brassica rapa subsp. trilocularis]|uniref:Uncharacterized protein n=1 Tax=Brassica rapa subsp. trilocularis TaxID=1813537 RepID=A0ABQ7L001_BRACM|nr:hypothetical protein IGI04_026942 [Brassica rapa subsp. trilocularis]